MIRLFNGDYKDYLKNIPDNSIDLIVTDPPYSFEGSGGGFYSDKNEYKRTYIDSLENLNCLDFDPVQFLNSVKSKMKKMYVYVFCNKALIADYIQWAKDNECNYDVLVICKSNPIPAYDNHYLSDLEYIIVIREPGTYFSKEKNIDIYRKWFMTTCKKGLHPAEKPVELVKRFITVGSYKGGVVFDPFMGSGTTGVAAKELGRSFIGCEIDNNYYNVCQERINNVLIKTNKNTLF